jgi:hypothetical protein
VELVKQLCSDLPVKAPVLSLWMFRRYCKEKRRQSSWVCPTVEPLCRAPQTAETLSDFAKEIDGTAFTGDVTDPSFPAALKSFLMDKSVLPTFLDVLFAGFVVGSC